MAWREHFSNGRTLALSVGGTMIAVVFGAQVSAWNHWVAIGCGYGAGLVLAVGALAVIAKSYLAPELTKDPIITVLSLIPVNVQMESMQWRRQHDGVNAVSAVVMNLPSESETMGGRAEGLAASLHFNDSSGSRLWVSKAYWLDSLENYVGMSVGSTRFILVGVIEGQTLSVFANNFEEARATGIECTAIYHGTVPQCLQFTDDLRVTVQVYSVETGKIFGKHTFPIPHNGEIVNAKGKTMKNELLEGPEALRNFQDGMTKLFQAPKPAKSPFKPSPTKPKDTSKD